MKQVSFFTALCVAMSLLLTSPAYAVVEDEEDYGEDFEEAEDRVYTEEETSAAIKKLSDLFTRMGELLNGVKDKASADAAAADYRKLFEESRSEDMRSVFINYQLNGHEANDELSRGTYSLYEAREKLRAVYFYGSADLAEAVSGDASAALEPRPIPAEMQDTLLKGPEDEEGVNIVVGVDEEEMSVSGGPGFSRETAWVSGASNRQLALMHSQMMLYQRYKGDVSVVVAEQKTLDNHVYNLITIDIVYDGVKYRSTIWVDISAGCKIYTPEQQQAAIDKISTLLRSVWDIIKTVSDKQSADAAVKHMEEIQTVLAEDASWADVRDVLSSLEREQIEKLMLSVFPAEEREAIGNRFRENDFYGSQKLKLIFMGM